MPTLQVDPEALWKHSAEIYARPGVAPLLLRLQDEYGIDVNMALFCHFVDCQFGLSLGEADVARIEAAVSAWNERIVSPLRALRRVLPKTPDHADMAELRAHIKQAEMAAERIAQSQIASVSLEPKQPGGAWCNLNRYLNLADDDLVTQLRQAIDRGSSTAPAPDIAEIDPE